jgi:putative membrane protein
MLIQILIALFTGILAGTFTGLVPGIHINMIGATLIALSASLLAKINPIYLIVFITAMAITHTFVDFIPSVFLGCPDTDTELSVLPGHELLKKGQGYEAIILTAYGSLAAVFLLILIVAPCFFLVPKLQDILLKTVSVTPFVSVSVMALILILVSGLLVILDKKRCTAFFVFILTGLLGLIVLGVESKGPLSSLFPGIGVQEPLLPLLTGLFGASMLVLSIKTKTQIPNQEITKPEIKNNLKKDFLKPLAGALVASPLASLLPGLGSSQAAIIGNTISKADRRGFLVLLGATNTLVMGFSFVSLYLISRTRTGAAVAINSLIGAFPLRVLILILAIVLLTGLISFFITLFLANFFSRKVMNVNYTKLSAATLGILVLVVFIISGFPGLIVLSVSAFTGIYCISLGVRRTYMMGCLLIPTIVFYLML